MTPSERAALYSLPLFVHWAFALTWERDSNVLRAAGRSQVIGLLFLFLLGCIFSMEAAVTSLIPSSDYVIAWGALGLHSVIAVAYVVFSGLLCYREYQSRPMEMPVLDTAAVRIETWASR